MIAVFAHRGLHVSHHENTIEAFEAAAALGVDGVELDVRRSADGRLVVHHDPRIEGLAIAQRSADDLPGYVPTLEGALEACGGRRVNVEVKNLLEPDEPTYDATGDFARAVVGRVVASGRAGDVLYSSFDLATCLTLAEASSGPVGWLLELDRDPMAAIERAAELGLAAVNPWFGVVSGAVVERAHSLGVGVNVWTVNARDDLDAMFALGVDAVITDDPALALATRDQRPIGPPSTMA